MLWCCLSVRGEWRSGMRLSKADLSLVSLSEAFLFFVKNVFQHRSDEGGSINFTKQVNLLFLLYNWFSFVTAQTSSSSSRQSILDVQSFQGQRKNRVKCACHMYLNLTWGLFLNINLTVILWDRSRPTIIIIIKYWAQEAFYCRLTSLCQYGSKEITVALIMQWKMQEKVLALLLPVLFFLKFLLCLVLLYTFYFFPFPASWCYPQFLLNPPFPLYLSFYAPLFLCQVILLPSVPYC